MSKKYYQIAKFETEEEFNKHFNSIYNSGYESGYEAGLAEAVSYMFEMLNHFSDETQKTALYMCRERAKETAIKNMNAGVKPYVPDDPAIRKSKKEINDQIEFNKLIKEVEKEMQQNRLEDL